MMHKRFSNVKHFLIGREGTILQQAVAKMGSPSKKGGQLP
jgi:hypothetical protein